jgi:hypothetical protein
MPRRWIVLRRIWIAAFTASVGMVILLPWIHSQSGFPVPREGIIPVQRWILLSIASLFFLLPHPARDVIVCSQRELLAWQLKSLFGSLVIGVSALICAAQINAARSDGLLALACALLIGCLLVSPWFFRLCAWRLWVGTALIIGGSIFNF